MYLQFKLSSLLRYISVLLLFFIPAQMAKEILPFPVLPFLAVATSFFTFFILKKQTNFIKALFILSSSLFILLFIPFGLPYCIQSISYNRLYLHYRLSFWIIIISVLFSLITSISFYCSQKWKKIEPFFVICVVIILFWFEGSHTLHLFTHPLHKTAFSFCFILIQIIRLTFFTEKTASPLSFFILYTPFLALLYFFALGNYNAASVSTNGGLMQPTLFRFDFSPYLTLQNEIKMNDSLVFIVQAPIEYSSTFMRRIYLSGWDPKKGFYESLAPDELPQETKVPSRFTEFPTKQFELRNLVSQDVFVVNFDPDSLIAFDYPVSVKPYQIWNSSSFSGAYSVKSNTTDFFPFQLFESQKPEPNVELGLSENEISFYTKIDSQTKDLLIDLTEELTQNIPGYYDKILAVTSFLKDGEYRYSLKPGIAADGNQLSHFLFTSKKGYCTYYAFSLALMLRSIGIPSRVAAGFFLQPDSATLNYFPIRANMAHAWVEVFFDKYGWISFDPTSTELAEGEDLEIQMSAGGDEFLTLLGEIIENKNLLTEKEGANIALIQTNSINQFFTFIKKNFLLMTFLLVFLLLLIIFFFLRVYPEILLLCTKNKRKKILLLYSKTQKVIRNKILSEKEQHYLKDLIKLSQKAKFSDECTEKDLIETEKISFILCNKGTQKGRSFILLFFILFSTFTSIKVHSQDLELSEILTSAKNAIHSENWENALTILSNGEKKFPNEGEISYLLGTIYFNASLYDSAYNAFSKAEIANYNYSDLYLRLSDTATYLNKDEKAFFWIKKYLEIHPEDLYGWSSFGWLCYKTNRLEEGIVNLNRLIDIYGPDANLCASLANLYTASFNYDDAKKQYTRAIEISEERNQTYLSAIYFYNRSILEEIFYNFDLAYEDTIKSLNSLPRASGYLMQGELELKKLSFKAAFSLYMKAWNIDSSPLATIGVAETLLLAGHPSQALQYLKHALSRPDLFWIANYGTTTDQYKADVHKLERDIYKYLINVEKRKVIHNFSTMINKTMYVWKYHFLAWKEDSFFRIHSKNVSQQYESTNSIQPRNSGIQLFIDSYYYQAFNSIRIISKQHLLRAKEIETDHIPASLPSYLFEEGLANHDISLLDQAISTLNPVWEKKYLAEAVAERLKLTKKNEIEIYNKYISILYTICPSSFITHNISFPVTLSFSQAQNKKTKKQMSIFKKYLKSSRFILSDSSLYFLDIQINDSDISFVFVNKNTKLTIYTQVIHNFDFSRKSYTDVINNLPTELFSVNLGFDQD
ncbi:MAG TPA: transglutaminase domain-containing protein [Treponemataceae bacterium]|nr:transglutaminase domain-containing protein [Treponemataceae bacterium]